jgi:hypothetical protein
MTLSQIKSYNDTNIRQKATAGSVTRNDVATAIDNLADYLSHPPTAQLTLSSPAHEAGDTGPVTLTWQALPGDGAITAIIVAGTAVTTTGSTQSGSTQANLDAFADSTFTLTVASGSKTATASATCRLLTKLRIGTTAATTLTDDDIRALQVQQFATGYQYSGAIACSNQYLAIYIPSTFGTPQFKLNGLYNNAFTKQRDNQPFVNTFGQPEQGDLYLSNTLLTGTLNLEIL